MHLIALVDLLTLLLLVGTLIAFVAFMHGLKSQLSFNRLTIGFLVISILYYLFLFLEWALTASIFDRLEDLAGVLMPMCWGGLFYAILQENSNRELANSRHRYQMVVDNIDELIIHLDNENRIHFVSPSFCVLIGESTEELIGKNFLSVMATRGNPYDFNFLGQARIPPFTVSSETAIEIGKDIRWFTWDAKQLSGDNIKEGDILILGRDISAKKKAEQSLRESEERHRQFVENQPVGMFRSIIDGDGRFVMANAAMARMFGYPTVESFLKTPAVDLYRNPKYRQEVLKRLLAEDQIYGLEGEGKRRDSGEPFIFSLSLQLTRDDQGNPMYVDGTIVDITEHKQAEMRLEKSEQLHREAQRIAQLGHWERKIGDDCLIWSDEMYCIFEIEKTSSGASFDNFLTRVHPEDLTRIDEHMQHAIENRTAINIFNRVLLPDQRVKYVHCRGHVEYDNNGNPVRMIGTVQDVTKLKEAEIEKERTEQKLLQAQKLEAIGTLAGGIAHDFNNILASIIGFTELSITEIPEDHKTREYLKQVLQAGLRARDLVAHILSFSRQNEHRLETIQVHLIIKEVVKLLRASIPASIEIDQTISSRCCPVFADPIQLHQIIMNLCTNSYHAIGGRNGRITISLADAEIGPHDFPEVADVRTGRHIKLVVSDTGCGMDKATLEKIFDPYFTTKKKGEGTGLGLAVVHGIVKKHGGHISVYSEPGQGTSFIIYLPCATGQQTNDRIEVVGDVKGGDEHIFLVDDEEPITNMLTGLLRRMGYRVTTFNNADKALEFFQSQPKAFDLIITDMNMPIISGKELSSLIHEIAPEIPIIIQTGFAEDLGDDQLQSIGVRAIIKKPVLERELAQCIRSVIETNNC